MNKYKDRYNFDQILGWSIPADNPCAVCTVFSKIVSWFEAHEWDVFAIYSAVVDGPMCFYNITIVTDSVSHSSRYT